MQLPGLEVCGQHGGASVWIDDTQAISGEVKCSLPLNTAQLILSTCKEVKDLSGGGGGLVLDVFSLVGG